jgi:hypothetical protein
MSTVLAKFYIFSLESQRTISYDRDKNTGEYTKTPATESCRVKLSAVQGEPFGNATPMGTVDMTIANSAAAAVFRKVWQEYCANTDPDAKPPEFYVTFHLDEGKGAIDLANH